MADAPTRIGSGPTAGDRFRWPGREIIAEFLGTFVLVLLSVCGNCIAVSNSMYDGEMDVFSSIILALSVAAAYFVAGGVSGGHFNPLVTVGFSIVGKFHPSHVMPYIVTQMVAALAATGLAAFIYKDPLNGRFDNNVHTVNVEISSAFAGQPNEEIPWTVFAMSTFMACFMLLIMLHAIFDIRNMKVPRSLCALYAGFFAYGIVNLVFSSIWRGGPQINAARDIASRLLNYGRGYELASPWFVTTTTVFAFAGAITGSWFYVTFEEYLYRHAKIEPSRPVGRPKKYEKYVKEHNPQTGSQESVGQRQQV